MKTKFQLLAVFLIAALASLFAQGPLTPPGAPAPTMKTLAQIEARAPISSAPFTISQSGSYYLTNNINVTSGSAISITADNVTLDLNGFTLSSTEASPAGTGILLSSGRSHVHILNGHIKGNVSYSGGSYTGSGFAYGIYFSGGVPRNARVTGVSVSGCLLDGINLQLDRSTAVESCTVRMVGGNGIVASSASHSTANQCGLTGILAFIASDCQGESVGSGTGVGGSMIQNCYGSSVGGHGVNGTTARNCYGSSSGNSDGVRANTIENCYGTTSGAGSGVNALESAHNCSGTSTQGHGVNAATASNCSGLASSGSGDGIHADDADNCKGSSIGTGNGVWVSYTASNCRGYASQSGIGVRVEIGPAFNCHGQSGSGYGVFATTAQNCYALTSSGSAGLRANIALNCYGVASPGGFSGILADLAQNCHGVSLGGGYALNAGRAIGCSGNSFGSGNDFNPTTHRYFCGSGPLIYP